MPDKLTATDYKKKETRERRKKEQGYLQHLKDLWENFRHHWLAPAYPVDQDNCYAVDNPVRFKRSYREQRSKQIKKKCNRQLRNTDELYQNGEYKKQTEFWWEYY